MEDFEIYEFFSDHITKEELELIIEEAREDGYDEEDTIEKIFDVLEEGASND